MQVMQPDSNQTLFGQAVRDGVTDQILWLLQSGAVDVNYRDVTHDLETPMMRLCHADLRPPASQSSQHVDDPRGSLWTILEAVRRVDLNVDQQDALGRTLAMHACISNNEAMLRFAIERECNPAVADRKGKNLMHYVAMSGSDEIASLVLDNLVVDQALRTLDYQGYSPVDLARQKKHSALARQLSNALVNTKRDVQVTVREDSSSVSRDNAYPHRNNASGDSVVAHSRPPLTRRDARVQLTYGVPVSDQHTSSPDSNTHQRYRSSTPPPATTTPVAANGDIHQQGGLVRSVSLRRSYKVRRVADSSIQDNMTPIKAPPVQPFYSPLSSSRDNVNMNSSADFLVTSKSKYSDGIVLRKPETEQNLPLPITSQMLASKMTTRAFPARPNSDQPFREEPQPSILRNMSSAVVDVKSFLSPRPRHRLIHGNKQIRLLENHDAKEKILPMKADAGVTCEETVSSISPRAHFEENIHDCSDELPPHIRRQGTDRRTERRSSISLPDLRDMTGCLVTSRDALKLQDLARGRKSRITLVDLDRRDIIKSCGTCADHSGLQDNKRPGSSGSDVSMDSNFEDEKPIRRP